MDHAELNANGETFADVLYPHALHGAPVPVEIGVIRSLPNSRLSELRTPGVLCEAVFVEGTRVMAAPRVPAHLRGAGVTNSVIRNMESYARPRQLAWVGFDKIVNPGLLAALRRRGFSSLSPSLDAHLDSMVAYSAGSEQAFLRVFAALQITARRTGKGVVLVKLLPAHPESSRATPSGRFRVASG